MGHEILQGAKRSLVRDEVVLLLRVYEAPREDLVMFDQVPAELIAVANRQRVGSWDRRTDRRTLNNTHLLSHENIYYLRNEQLNPAFFVIYFKREVL